MDLSGIVQAASPALGGFASIINTYQQNQANVDSNKEAENMYHEQRQNALADRAFENDYNSPAAQMERLKKAGLNPNLVYGNGAAATASVHTGQPSSNAPTAKAPPPLDMGQFFSNALSVADMALKSAQTNLTAEQLNTQKNETMLKRALVENTAVDTTTKGLHNDLLRGTLDADIATANANLQKIKMETQTMFSAQERAEIMNARNVKESVQRVMSMRQERAKSRQEVANLKQQEQNMLQDYNTKKLDEYMASHGISPNSPYWVKMVGALFNKHNQNSNVKP